MMWTAELMEKSLERSGDRLVRARSRTDAQHAAAATACRWRRS
jgi:hypothetical protein